MGKKVGPVGNTKDMIKALRRYDNDVTYLKRRIKSAETLKKAADERLAVFSPRLELLIKQGPPAKEV